MSKKRLILTGIIGRYPVGGVTWCALHYIAGFQRLGYEVFYLEDTGECGFDPLTNGISTDPSYATRYIRQHLEIVGLENAWSYIDHMGRYHGKTHTEVSAICHQTDLMVNLSGGCWFARPEYDALTKIFIDTDPGFTQRNMVEDDSLCAFFSAYDAFFTFALNVDSPSCTLATTPFRWHPTLQPLVLEFWPVTLPPDQSAYTTIMSWRIDSFPGMGKGKQGELLRMIDLPKKCRRRLKLAIAGKAPSTLLSQHGWEVIDAVAASIDPFAYRSFIQASRAELGFAKAMYVETHSGWFSDRTQCYLASGRPALVRDTGFSQILPCGEGLIAFSNEQEILDGIEEIERDYTFHCRQARELAETYFSAEQILRNLLQTAGVS